jgi:hypothetical protein
MSALTPSTTSSFERIKSVFNLNNTSNLSNTQKWVLGAIAVASLAISLFLGTIPTVLGCTLALISSLVFGVSFFILTINWAKSWNSFENFAKTRTGEGVTDKDVILILSAAGDHNGAFGILNADSISALKKQTKYTVICKTIDSVEQLHEVVSQVATDQKNKIQSLWIRAHGYPEGFSLSNQTPTNIKTPDISEMNCGNHMFARFSPVNSLLTNSISLLSKDATIVLESCSTGKPLPNRQLNIAQKISALAGGRKVFAPTRDTASVFNKIASLDSFEYRFYDISRKKRWLIFDKISEIFLSAMAVYTNMIKKGSNPFLEDITACYSMGAA